MCSFLPDDFFQHIKYIKNIGKGSYGKVDLYQHLDGKFYAIKFQKIIQDQNNSRTSSSILVDADSLVRLRNVSKVIQIEGICYRDQDLALIMEAMDVNLDQFIKLNIPEVLIPLTEKFLLSMIESSALFEFLNINHFDIKPENILVRNDQSNIVFKITDFGLSQPYFSSCPPYGEVFTLWYRPPEFLANRNRDTFTSFAGDIWSIALSAVEMLTRTPPIFEKTVPGALDQIRYLSNSPLNSQDFYLANQTGNISGRIEVSEILRDKLSPHHYSGIDPNLIELLSLMLSLNPNERPTGSIILNQSFQEQINPLLIESLIPIEYPRYVDDRGIFIISHQYNNIVPKIIGIEIYTRFLALKPLISSPSGSETIYMLHMDTYSLAAIQIADQFINHNLQTIDLVRYYRQLSNSLSYINNDITVDQVGLAEKIILITLGFSVYNINLGPVIDRAVSNQINLENFPPSHFSQPLYSWFI